MVTAFAIESEEDNEQAIMVSLDITKIDKELQDSVRDILKLKLKDFDGKKTFHKRYAYPFCPESQGKQNIENF